MSEMSVHHASARLAAIRQRHRARDLAVLGRDVDRAALTHQARDALGHGVEQGLRVGGGLGKGAHRLQQRVEPPATTAEAEGIQ